MSTLRLAKSILLKFSILSKFKTGSEAESPTTNIQSNINSDEDYLFLHILDCMGALSCLRANQKAVGTNDDGDVLLRSKYRVFWQTVREIAEQEAVLEDRQQELATTTPMPINVPLNVVLESFPNESKQSDGRMWLPLHFAASLPNINLEDIDTLFAAHPAAIKTHTDKKNLYNPCHLAVMKSNPRLEVIQQLQIYYPRFGASLAFNSDSPLHLAAMYSSSAAIVRELAQLYPAALGSKNKYGDTPLHVAAKYSNSVAIVRELAQLHPAALEMTNECGDTPFSTVAADIPPEALGKLQVLLDLAPQTAMIANIQYLNNLPLSQLLHNPSVTLEMVAIVLAAYRDAVNIPNDEGWLPIHCAARYPSIEVLKMIMKENTSDLSLVVPEVGSLAHFAVRGYRLDNLQYIRSIVPEILMTVESFNNNTPLHDLVKDDNYGGGDTKESLRSLCSPLSEASDILRYLLRHCPSLAAAKNSNQHTLYDFLPEDDAGLAYARRLLLLAGASALYPGVLQELNYAARREALLLFYSAATKLSIFSRIRNAAGGAELMRTIVCFL
eukprot:gene22987-29782_t